MGYHEKKERYSELYSNGLGRWASISYRGKRKPGRKGDNTRLPEEVIKRRFTGQIVRVYESSLDLCVGGDVIIHIDYQAIYKSIYINHGNRIKASLYYGVHKPKSKRV